MLFHSQHLSYDEIALVVTRPVGTVKTWLHCARAQLAEQLSRRGIVGPGEMAVCCEDKITDN